MRAGLEGEGQQLAGVVYEARLQGPGRLPHVVEPHVQPAVGQLLSHALFEGRVVVGAEHVTRCVRLSNFVTLAVCADSTT